MLSTDTPTHNQPPSAPPSPTTAWARHLAAHLREAVARYDAHLEQARAARTVADYAWWSGYLSQGVRPLISELDRLADTVDELNTPPTHRGAVAVTVGEVAQ